jgi:hypothetical protein
MSFRLISKAKDGGVMNQQVAASKAGCAVNSKRTKERKSLAERTKDSDPEFPAENKGNEEDLGIQARGEQ